MKRHLSYLRYLLVHKYWVYVAGRMLGVSRVRLLVHDWHKLLPDEWFPYARTFYNSDGTKSKYVATEEFAQAWLFHQHRGSHHWQHWLITWDNGKTTCLEMPLECANEMVSDWCGAGKAITGKWEVTSWYEKNRDRIHLHPSTREYVESLLRLWDSFPSYGVPLP